MARLVVRVVVVSASFGSCLAGAFAAAVLALLAAASPGLAAFPGADGLLVTQPVGGDGLILVGPDGQHPQRICNDPTCPAGLHPSWSPDGEKILIGSNYQFSVIYPDGTCLACNVGPSDTTGYTDTAPTFTTAGNVLAMALGNAQATTGFNEVFGVDGVQLRRGVPPGPALAAAWSVNGRVALVRRVHRRDEVFVTDTHQRHVSQLTFTGGGSPSWAPDGNTLAVNHLGVVELIDLHGHVIRRLAVGGSPAYAPDGRSVAYVALDGQLMVIGVGGGRPRPVGSVHGTSVDWQPVPATPPPVCRPPADSTVVASTPDAVITSRTYAETAYLACLRSANRQRYLGEAFNFYGGTDPTQSEVSQLGDFALAGDYVAFFYHYELDYKGQPQLPPPTIQITLTNLLTDQTTAIPIDAPWYDVQVDPSIVTKIALSPDGLLAWETTWPDPNVPGSDETISALDRQGEHTLDSETVTTSPGLADLMIAGNEVTWTHDGQPRSATLQP
jgi:WD40-like Beta Propeller Repeat